MRSPPPTSDPFSGDPELAARAERLRRGLADLRAGLARPAPPPVLDRPSPEPLAAADVRIAAPAPSVRPADAAQPSASAETDLSSDDPGRHGAAGREHAGRRGWPSALAYVEAVFAVFLDRGGRRAVDEPRFGAERRLGAAIAGPMKFLALLGEMTIAIAGRAAGAVSRSLERAHTSGADQPPTGIAERPEPLAPSTEDRFRRATAATVLGTRLRTAPRQAARPAPRQSVRPEQMVPGPRDRSDDSWLPAVAEQQTVARWPDWTVARAVAAAVPLVAALLALGQRWADASRSVTGLLGGEPTTNRLLAAAASVMHGALLLALILLVVGALRSSARWAAGGFVALLAAGALPAQFYLARAAQAGRDAGIGDILGDALVGQGGWATFWMLAAVCGVAWALVDLAQLRLGRSPARELLRRQRV